MNVSVNSDIKANAQAGAVNFAANDMNLQPTLNLNLQGDGSRSAFPLNFIQGVRSAVHPIKAAKDEAEAACVRAKSISDIVDIYKKAFPTFSDAQIFLLAYGYPTSTMQAENVLNVLNRAGGLADGSDASKLDSSCIDMDIRGAQTAYDDELREIWAKLISQEVSTGHARSKRTKALLEQMDVEDAIQLLSVLRCCLWTPVGPSSRPEPVPLLFRTSADDSWTYNGGMVSTEAVSTLDSLGVLTSGEWISFTVDPGDELELYSLQRLVCIRNNGKEKLQLDLGRAKFLKLGIELAEVVGASVDERVLQIMKESISADVRW